MYKLEGNIFDKNENRYVGLWCDATGGEEFENIDEVFEMMRETEDFFGCFEWRIHPDNLGIEQELRQEFYNVDYGELNLFKDEILVYRLVKIKEK
jgi:hypothetical protein